MFLMVHQFAHVRFPEAYVHVKNNYWLEPKIGDHTVIFQLECSRHSVITFFSFC